MSTSDLELRTTPGLEMYIREKLIKNRFISKFSVDPVKSH